MTGRKRKGVTMSKEAIDKAIEMRQQVIDGGVLYNDGNKSRYDIVNDVKHFVSFVENLEDYTVRMTAKKKRAPMTKEDLDARFLACKTLRIVCNDGMMATISNWIDDTVVLEYTQGSYATICISEIMQDKFIDGDPCYKEIEE